MQTTLSKYRRRRRSLQAVTLSLIFATAGVSAQDPQYSQYYASPLLIAPSFAGNSLGTRAFINFRDQWAKLPGSFVTYSVALDNNFYALNSGFGLLAVRDVAGSAGMGTSTVKGLYSYRFNVTDEWRIRPGIGFSFNQRSMNSKKAVYGDQISTTGIDDITLEPPIPPYNYIDAVASIVVYDRVMWFGLSVDHLLRPNMSFNRLSSRAPMTFLQFGGVNIPRLNRVGKPSEIITLNYLIKASQVYRQFDIGVNWYHAPMLMGFGWRGFLTDVNSFDALIFTVGIAFNSLSVNYSYDFTINKLGPATGGSHEITLSIGFNEGNKTLRRGAIPCPDVVKFKMFGDKESFR